MVDIIPFHTHHQHGVTLMMEEITNEFPEQIYSPDSKNLSEMSLLPAARYWVALAGEELIGTVGLIMLDHEMIALKAMFVKREQRGKDTASRLLATVQDWAVQNGISHIYLGTMTQFKAAQRFYEKHGFSLIDHNKLPAQFPANPVDKVFYHKLLRHTSPVRG